jgi:hypothetical protein
MYVACYYEEKPVFNASVKFVDILSLEIAPKTRRARSSDLNLNSQFDLDKPVYELRGSIIEYNCYNVTEGYPRGKNCSVSRIPKSTGKCLQTTFGDWHCVLGGGSLVRPETKMPAPQ